MKRQTFLIIAATVGTVFSLYMFLAPAKMMEGMGIQSNDSINAILQVMCVMLFSISVITFLARKDEGSIALRAIIIGSIFMHIASIPIDWIAFQRGVFTQISGLIPGTIVHIILAIGFILCLKNLKQVAK